uniref:PAS domain S-box protein n=1 Tax=uncultured Draconibacterium sp. TaxID=1573823 RepID=UPI003217E0B4
MNSNIQPEKKSKKQHLNIDNDIEIIAENLPNVVWTGEITPEGNYINTYISEIADEILGLPRGTINNSFEKYFSYVVPEDLVGTKKMIKKGLANPGQTYTYAYRVKRGNGEIAWVESTGRIYIFDKKVKVFGITVDITDQKKIENRLKENEYLLEQAQKVANFGSYILDIQTGYWISSENLDAIFGIDYNYIKDVEGWLQIVHPEDRKMMKDYFLNEVVAQQQSFDKQYRIRKINSDELIWVHGMGKLEFDEAGNPIKMIGTIQNINKRIQADALLKESEDRYRSLLANLPVGVFRSTIGGKVLSANQAMAEIYGYSSVDEMLRVPAQNYYAKGNPRELMVKQLLENDYIIDYETQEFKKDGTLIWVSANYKLIRDERDGEFLIDGVVIDITERKKAELELAESEKLLSKITDHFPNSCISVIEKDLTIGYSGGQELIKRNIDPAALKGLKLDEFLGDKAGFVKSFYEKTFKGEECNFELIENDEVLSYKTVPLYNATNEIEKILVVAENITEQKQKENELLEAKAKAEESTERFELAMQVTLDGPYDWNLVTNEIYFSDRWKEILGYKPDELPNDFSVWEKLTDPDGVQKSWNVLKRHIAGELDRFEMEFRMKHKKGHWVDILSRAIAHFNPEGKAVRVVGTHIDITETKKAEKQLKENEERFRKLIEHLPIGIAVYKPVNNGNDFKFINLNKSALKIINSTKKEMIGQTLLKKFPNMHISPLYEAFKKVNETGKDEFIPSFYYRDNIREGWRENYVYKLQSGEIVAIFRDTTELKNAEENLKKHNAELTKAKLLAEQNQKRFKALHDASFGGIAIHDEGIILDCNRGLTELTGLKRKELIGMDILILFAKRSKRMVKKRIEEKYEKAYEGFGIRKNGEEYPLRIEGRMIPYNGKQVRVVEFRDITELKKAEHELIAAKEKAEESDRLKTAFLANMSHEIRTPMNGILGFTSLLKTPNLTGEEQNKYINIIQQSGNRMLQTVNDIIEVAKIETGQVTVTQAEVNVWDLLDFLYNFFKPEAEKKSIQLLVKKDSLMRECVIYTDEIKLNSILTNLVKNAIKYSTKGLITIGCKKEPGYLKFSIKDEGIGIPANRLKAIFDRFVQADIEDKRVHEGSGLGLTITKSYAQMLGGEVWVESREGEGSTFYATIAYNMVNHPKLKSKSDNMEKNRNNEKQVRILVAEDDNVSFILLKNILSLANCTLTQVKNGEELVDRFKQNSDFDLILMDIKMPEMDGITATKIIREFNKTIPIIAQTAYALEGDREKALNAGFNDYITKPIVKSELIEIVNRYSVSL